MPSYKLCYFNGRGLGEVSRLIFAQAGQEYEDFRWERDDWPKHKPNAPTGQGPWLEVDGAKIGQSTAIARYLAKQFDLAGKGDLEQAQVDMVVCCMEDLRNTLMPIFAEKDEEKQAAIRAQILAEKLPAAFERLDNLLTGDFFVGNAVTWADLHVAHYLSMLCHFKVEGEIEKYSKLRDHKARVEALPNIAAWIAKRPQSEF